MIWNVPAETMPREELMALQLARLQDLTRRVYERVPFSRAAFDRARVRPEQIRSLDDIRRLPCTRKTDLRDYYPFGLFAVPRDLRSRCASRSPRRSPARRARWTRRRLW